jgi:tetratricopeptide (TPR) repeat protein
VGLFVGDQRRHLVDSLVAATLSPSRPRLITITGPLGSGKSRIVQELYAQLASHQPEPAYWPSAISRDDRSGADPGLARKQVGPAKFAVASEAEIPFLWWGISCERRQSGGYSAALLHDAEQLYLHTLSIEARWGRGRRLAKAASDPRTRDRAFKIAGLATTLAGPLGIVVGAATATGYALSTRDAKDLARDGAEAIARRRSSAAEDQRDLDVQVVVQRKQLELADDLASMLSGAVSGRPPLPTVVVVDDAHWADDGVLHLIRRILEHPDAPIIVVATAWPGELERQRRDAAPTGLASIIDAFGPEQCETHQLPFLATADLAAIVTELAPDTDEAIANALCLRADGNPLTLRLLLAQQMVRHAISHGRIELTLADVGRLPSGIETLHRQLWDELPDDVRRTLAAGASTGERLVIPLASAAAAATGVEEPERQLREAADVHGWIRAVQEDLYEFTESSRRSIAEDPGNMSERQHEVARSALLTRSRELTRSAWPGSLAARSELFAGLVGLTEQGLNDDLGVAHVAAVQLAEILHRTNDLVEERRVLELAVTWSRAAENSLPDDQLKAVIELARVANTLGEFGSRDRLRAEAHALALNIVAQRPLDPVAIDELGESHVRMGDTARYGQDLPSAEYHYVQAESLARKALTLAPERSNTLTSLYYAHVRLGDLALSLGRREDAHAWYESGLSFARRAIASVPDDPPTARECAFALLKLGESAFQLGHHADAAGHLHEALTILDQLVVTDPEDTWSRRDLAQAHALLGRLELAQGNTGAAQAHFRTSRELLVALAEARPDDRGVIRGLALAHEELGNLERAEGLNEHALDSYRASARVFRTAQRAQPDSPWAKLRLSRILQKLGSQALSTGALAEAADALTASAALAGGWLSLHPDDDKVWNELAQTRSRLGAVARQQGNNSVAHQHLLGALEIWQRLLVASPLDRSLGARVAGCHTHLGDLQRRLADFPAARRNYEEAQTIYVALSAEAPDDPTIIRESCATLSKLATTAQRLRDTVVTERSLQAVIEGAARLEALVPGDPRTALLVSDLETRLAESAGPIPSERVPPESRQ